MHNKMQELIINKPELIEKIKFVDELINNFKIDRVIKCNTNYNDLYNILNFDDYLDKYYCLNEIYDESMYIIHYISCSNYLMDIYPNYKVKLKQIIISLNDLLVQTNSKIIVKR